MKYEMGICSCHGERRLIVNRTHWMCYEGNRKRLDGQKSVDRAVKHSKAIRRYSKTRQAKTRAQTEADALFYAKIWDERLHRCVFCDEYLRGVLKNYNVHHVFAKSKFPELRYVKDNCVLTDLTCHQQVETGKYIDRMIKVILATAKKLVKKKLLIEIGSPNVYRIKDWVAVKQGEK